MRKSFMLVLMESIKLGVFLTPDEHRRVKIATAGDGYSSMTQWVAALIRERLKINPHKNLRKLRNDGKV